MFTNDAAQFAKYISNFVDVWLGLPAYIQLVLFNLFSCKYQGKDNYQEIVNLDAAQLKQIIFWYIINSEYMNLLNSSRNGAKSFRQYKNFKLRVYDILGINYEALSSSIDIYLLLQDAYELQDASKYDLLVKILLQKISFLLQNNKQIEVITLLKLANSEETLEFFVAFVEEDKNKFRKILIDVTLEHIKYLHINTKNLRRGSSSNLWQTTKIETDYYLDMALFRQEIYKSIGFTEKEVSKIIVSGYLFLTKEELANAYSDYFARYKNIYLKLQDQDKDFEEIVKIKDIRRQLLDYVEFINDPDKCAEIINFDANLLQHAYQNNMEAIAYYLLGVDYKDIKLLDYVFHNLPQDTSSALQLIKLALLQSISFSYNKFYGDFDRVRSAFNFKREVFKALGLSQYNRQIEALKNDLFRQEDMCQPQYWLNVKRKFKIIEGYVLYCEDSNHSKIIWKNFIYDVVKYFNNPQLWQKIFTSNSAHRNLVSASLALYFYNEHSISLEHVVNYIKVPSDRTITKDHLLPEDIHFIKESLFGKEYLANPKEIMSLLLNNLINALNAEDHSIDLFNASFLKINIELIFDSILLRFDPIIFADVVSELPDLVLKLVAKIMRITCIDQLTSAINLTNKQKYLLAVGIVRKIYKEREYHLRYNSTDFAREKTYGFLLKAYQHLEKRFEALDSSEKLFNNLNSLPVEQHHKLYETVIEGKVLLEKAYLAQDVDEFAKIISYAANFLMQLYNNKQVENIVKCLRIANSEDLYVVFRYLETKHLQALKRWLINYYVDNYKVSSAVIMSCSSLQKTREQFKKQCYQQLGIELADAIDLRVEKISENDVDLLFDSIKSLANNSDVKIETYEVIIEYLSKKYDVTTKPNLLPTETDSTAYHALYDIMRAIRLCYVSGHVFSILLDKIKINDFNLGWEGAYGRVMLDYLNKHYIAALQQYPRNNNMPNLAEDLRAAILSSEEKNVSYWVDDKLLNDKIIAVDVTLYDGMHSGHAVGAVFWKDIAIFTDRGVSVLDDFSGIAIYKINDLSNRKKVISELIATRDKPISSKNYKLLKARLAGKQIHQIAMSPQIRGNCAFSSSAEPIHLSIVFMSFLQEFTQTKNLIDSCIVAEEVSVDLHSELMAKVYYETVANLYKFFKEKPEINFPLQLFAHIDLLNIYKIKNKEIESLAICIPWEAKLAAYQYYQDVFTTVIKNEVMGVFSRYSNALTIPEQQFRQYGRFLSKSFLENNEDFQEFRQAVLRVQRSALFGDIKISPMLFSDTFDLILSSPSESKDEESTVDYGGKKLHI